MKTVLATVAALGAAWISGGVARACAPAPHAGDSVDVQGEEALIVYDASARREHFIRRADFDSTASDFGFLVPTPSPPELGEVQDGLFATLADAVAPAVEHRTEWIPMTCCSAPFQMTLLSRGASDDVVALHAVAPSGVDVLSTARVAGLDATVVRATDTDALGAWLSEHGYEMRPALTRWLAPYVEAGFAITAFKIAKGDAVSSAVGTRAVRMTFATERPFYPYREPSDTRERLGRRLRVFLVASSRHDGRLDDGSPWHADVTYARPIADPASLLDSTLRPAGALWLTSYIDTSPLRATGGDLWFAAHDTADEVVPDPIIVTDAQSILPLPVEPIIAIGVGVFVWRRRKRRKSAA